MVFNVLPRKTKSASEGGHDVAGLLLHDVIYAWVYISFLKFSIILFCAWVYISFL